MYVCVCVCVRCVRVCVCVCVCVSFDRCSLRAIIVLVGSAAYLLLQIATCSGMFFHPSAKKAGGFRLSEPPKKIFFPTRPGWTKARFFGTTAISCTAVLDNFDLVQKHKMDRSSQHKMNRSYQNRVCLLA